MNNIGYNLKKIRLLKNLSLEEAGKLLNLSKTGVSKYEKGDILPDSKKLLEFANAYNIKSIDILKTYNIPKMNFSSFRKKSRLTGRKLDLLKSVIEEEVAKYLEINELSSISEKKVLFKNYECKNLEDAEESANKFRDFIKISALQPISDLTSVLENLGILIIYIKNPENIFDDFDGLSEIVNKTPVIVLLDDMKDGARQRFTIAHELAHLVLDIKNENIDDEKLCNRFASALLMPKEAVINEFGISRGNINFYELTAFKKEYKVSYGAIIYRLKDLLIISEYLYRQFCIIINQRINKNDPDPIKPEKSYQFKKMVYKLEADKIISLNKACELLGVSFDEYNKENNNCRY